MVRQAPVVSSGCVVNSSNAMAAFELLLLVIQLVLEYLDQTMESGKNELPRVGLEPTTLCYLGRVLFLLSYQGSSAGRALSLQHNTTKGKGEPQITLCMVITSAHAHR